MSTPYPISALPFLTIDPSWVEQSQAFFHEETRLLKARLQLLFACWRGIPAASIPNSVAYVCQITGLNEADAREYWNVLTEGMTRTDDARMRHDGMYAMWSAVHSRYQSALEEFASASVMTSQDPEQFSLVAVEAAKPKARGKTAIPKGFGYQMFPELLATAHELGCVTDEDKAWLMTSFIDYNTSRDERVKSWPAHFRVWSRRQFEQFRAVPPSKRVQQATGAHQSRVGYVAAIPSRKDAVAERNLAMLMGSGGSRTVDAQGCPTVDVQATVVAESDAPVAMDPLARMMQRNAGRAAFGMRSE